MTNNTTKRSEQLLGVNSFKKKSLKVNFSFIRREIICIIQWLPKTIKNIRYW